MYLSDYFFEDRQGIKLLRTKTAKDAFEAAKKIIYGSCDSRTALFLSGGSTPRNLYRSIAQEKKLTVGAVGMVDERYGEKWHEASNEKMIRDEGLLKYFENRKIRFYSILEQEEDLENTALQYDETLRYLLSYFPKSIAILGIGADGHTAGLPAGNQISKEILDDPSSLAVGYSDKNKYGDRITMTFLALARVDVLLLLVLGTEKREALKIMFDPSAGSGQADIEEIPARFYLKPEIAVKTILITDQRV